MSVCERNRNNNIKCEKTILSNQEDESEYEYEEDTIGSNPPTCDSGIHNVEIVNNNLYTDTDTNTDNTNADDTNTDIPPPTCDDSSNTCFKTNAFRIAEKKYKMQRTPTWQKKIIPTDYEDVIDLRNISSNTEENKKKIVHVASKVNDNFQFHVKSSFNKDWKFPTEMSNTIPEEGEVEKDTKDEKDEKNAKDIKKVDEKSEENETNQTNQTNQIPVDPLAGLSGRDLYFRRKQLESQNRKRLLRKTVTGYKPDHCNVYDDNSSSIYAISGYPGLFVISRAVSYVDQIIWALRCYILYPEFTNLTYLHQMREEDQDLFLKTCVEYKDYIKTQPNLAMDDFFSELNIQKIDDGGIKADITAQGDVLKSEKKEKINKNDKNGVGFVKNVKNRDQIVAIDKIFKPLLTLRWSSLGFIYDWTRREYHEGFVLPFPSELSKLAKKTLIPLQERGFVGIASDSTSNKHDNFNDDDYDDNYVRKVPFNAFRSEAGIINYYPLPSSMGAHVDDAEPAVDRPIVSFSVGASAVFLIGSATRSDPPTSLFLRSGDILIQEGPARLSFHAVPRIIENSTPDTAFRHAASSLTSHIKILQGEDTGYDENNVGLPPIPRNPGIYKVNQDVEEDLQNTLESKRDPIQYDGGYCNHFNTTDDELKDLMKSLYPYLKKYNLTMTDIIDFVIVVLTESRLNFNIRQVIDERYGNPSEVRDKRPISAVLDGLHAKDQPRENM